MRRSGALCSCRVSHESRRPRWSQRRFLSACPAVGHASNPFIDACHNNDWLPNQDKVAGRSWASSVIEGISLPSPLGRRAGDEGSSDAPPISGHFVSEPKPFAIRRKVHSSPSPPTPLPRGEGSEIAGAGATSGRLSAQTDLRPLAIADVTRCGKCHSCPAVSNRRGTRSEGRKGRKVKNGAGR